MKLVLILGVVIVTCFAFCLAQHGIAESEYYIEGEENESGPSTENSIPGNLGKYFVYVNCKECKIKSDLVVRAKGSEGDGRNGSSTEGDLHTAMGNINEISDDYSLEETETGSTNRRTTRRRTRTTRRRRTTTTEQMEYEYEETGTEVGLMEEIETGTVRTTGGGRTTGAATSAAVTNGTVTKSTGTGVNVGTGTNLTTGRTDVGRTTRGGTNPVATTNAVLKLRRATSSRKSRKDNKSHASEHRPACIENGILKECSHRDVSEQWRTRSGTKDSDEDIYEETIYCETDQEGKDFKEMHDFSNEASCKFVKISKTGDGISPIYCRERVNIRICLVRVKCEMILSNAFSKDRNVDCGEKIVIRKQSRKNRRLAFRRDASDIHSMILEEFARQEREETGNMNEY